MVLRRRSYENCQGMSAILKLYLSTISTDEAFLHPPAEEKRQKCTHERSITWCELPIEGMRSEEPAGG